MEEFIDAYIEAALWSSTDDEGQPLDGGDLELAEETLAAMRKDCEAFYEAHKHLFNDDHCEYGRNGYSPVAHAGHDFWLTRNGHGCGFWDGDWKEPAADVLDKAAHRFGQVDLYVGDDNRIYAM